MSGQTIFGKNTRANSCFPVAPDISGCAPCCEPRERCSDVAPCKTRLRDALHMRLRETERTLTLTEISGAQLPLVLSRVGMTLRRRGSCQVIACFPPLRTTLDGGAVFRWPDTFLRQPPGQYEGDVTVNGCEIGSVLLLKPDQFLQIESVDVGEEDFGCSTDACNTCACSGGQPSCTNCSSCGAYAEPDGEPDHVSAGCGGCEEC